MTSPFTTAYSSTMVVVYLITATCQGSDPYAHPMYPSIRDSIQRANDKINESRERIAELTNRVDQQSDAIERNRSRIESLEGRQNDLATEHQQALQEVQQEQQRIASAQNEIWKQVANNTERLANCYDCVEKILEKLETSGFSKAELLAAVSDLEAKIKTLQTQQQQSARTVARQMVDSLSPEPLMAQPTLGIRIRGRCTSGHAIVASIDHSGLAYKAGIRPGDHVESINGQPIHNLDDASRHALQSRVLVIRWWRSRQLYEGTVRID